MASISLLRDGKLKPGVYKIQNVASQNFVDVQDNQKDLCCRPINALGDMGQWEFIPSGPGYTIRRLESGKPDQFCTVLNGKPDKGGRVPVSVSTFPATWRVELVLDHTYRETGPFFRFFWGATNVTWDLAEFGSREDRTPVHYKDNEDNQSCRVWKLLPT